MAPKVVVFDLGKVLVDFDYGIAARKLAAMSKVDPDRMQELVERSNLLVQFETGITNRGQFFREVCDATGYCGTRRSSVCALRTFSAKCQR